MKRMHVHVSVESIDNAVAFYSSDPAGIAWETFFTTGESTDYGHSVERGARLAQARTCCEPQSVAATQSASTCCA